MNHSNKVLVTGGCGFIGSHIVDKLVSNGFNVIVIDNLSANNDVFYYNEKATYYNLDVCDKSIEKIFEGVTVVFHLAAESRINACMSDPLKAANTNIVGTFNLLEVCLKHKVKRFIYSSTSAAYGLTEVLPTDESVSVDCLNQYSLTKYCGEKVVQFYNKTHGLDSCIFRYFNVYGERSPTMGIYAPVVGVFLRQKQAGEPLTIVGDGEQRRDFIHVSDIVEANFAAMNYSGLINSEIFNVGSGVNHSINEIASWISENKVPLESRVGEVRNNLADISKIREFFGWTPKINLKKWVNDNY